MLWGRGCGRLCYDSRIKVLGSKSEWMKAWPVRKPNNHNNNTRPHEGGWGGAAEDEQTPLAGGPFTWAEARWRCRRLRCLR